ncbi:MAG: nucleotidyltransferase family protein [Methanoregula sp.]|jgi:hypothetical protein|nr:nucleotidyltransferase family protein [Methanoregula sp.]MDD5024215.1 nucleotidyltransferase family protein [Methanoregula sp.]MDD5186978.1 nucleotidyltransferase family protein [Methanoregula sp.]
MKSSQQEILISIKKIKDEVMRTYPVKNIGVFGSVARNEQTESSDIDLLVEFSQPVGFVTFIRLESFLSKRALSKIQVISQFFWACTECQVKN